MLILMRAFPQEVHRQFSYATTECRLYQKQTSWKGRLFMQTIILAGRLAQNTHRNPVDSSVQESSRKPAT